MWALRNLSTDCWWANSSCAEFWGFERRRVPWGHALRFASHEDAIKIEDAHSRVMHRPGTFETIHIRGKAIPHEYIPVGNIVSCQRCEGCPLHCAVILIYVYPDPPELKPGTSPARLTQQPA